MLGSVHDARPVLMRRNRRVRRSKVKTSATRLMSRAAGGHRRAQVRSDASDWKVSTVPGGRHGGMGARAVRRSARLAAAHQFRGPRLGVEQKDVGRAIPVVADQIARVRHEDHPPPVAADRGVIAGPVGDGAIRAHADPRRDGQREIAHVDVDHRPRSGRRGRDHAVERGRRTEGDVTAVRADGRREAGALRQLPAVGGDADPAQRRRGNVEAIDVLRRTVGIRTVHEIGGRRREDDGPAVGADGAVAARAVDRLGGALDRARGPGPPVAQHDDARRVSRWSARLVNEEAPVAAEVRRRVVEVRESRRLRRLEGHVARRAIEHVDVGKAVGVGRTRAGRTT